MPNRLVHAGARHPRRTAAVLLIGVAAVAALVVAGMAVGKSFTLKVTKNVHVTNTPTKAFRVKAVDTHEAVAVGPSGYAVYTFQGETTHHIICQKTTSAKTNCWAFWPPVSPSGSGAVTKASGIRGKLGTFKNHGVTQLTLNGQPLYYFTPDIQAGNKHQATGDQLKTFGSIWHIVKAQGGGSAQSVTGSGTSTGQSTTSTSPTTPYGY
jgi:predicted lipoprotein with Yx(FWY)xxD motif